MTKVSNLLHRTAAMALAASPPKGASAFPVCVHGIGNCAKCTPAPVESGVVETVAKALRDVEWGQAMSWDAADETDRDYWRKSAKAAIAAFASSGEVTEAMIDDIAPTEEDRCWAANFIYPDLRPAYDGHDLLVETVAKVRVLLK